MNFNKKNNKNGFTLVELIVVVSIFGAIMVAILNFMRPANDIHNDTQSTMDSNIISSGLIEYMDDNLRYATNILVLKDYTGVPKVSDKGLVGDYPVAFTDCLIIDNQNPRGYQLKNYDPNKNDTATKLQARGGIIRVENLDQHGLDLNNTEDAYMVKGADFYDKFAFDIRVGTNILDEDFKKDSNLSTLQVSLTAYQPVYENGEFVFTKKKFDRGTSTDDEGNLVKNKGAVINLTNINARKNSDSTKLTFYDMNLQGAVAQAEALYSKKQAKWDYAFPVSGLPSDATEYQKKFYNPHTTLSYTSYENGESVSAPARYTYIFFQRPRNISTCKVSFVYAEDSPVLAGQEVSSSVEVKVGTKYKISATPANVSGYNAPYWLGPKGENVDPTVPYTIETDTVFTVHYTKKEPSVNDVNLIWWCNGESQTTVEQKATAPGEIVRATAPAAPSNLDLVKNDYVWVLKGTSTPYDQVNIDGPKEFEAKITPKLLVKFSTDGTSVDREYYITKGQVLPNVSVPNPESSKIPSGKVFDKWVLKDAEDKDVTTAIQANCTFIAKFKDNTSSGGGSSSGGSSSGGSSSMSSASVGETGSDMGWARKMPITIVNNSSSTVNVWRVVIEFEKNTSVNQIDDWKVSCESGSGNSFTLISKDDQYNYASIGPNGSYSFNVLLNGNAGNKIKSITVTAVK